MIAVSDSQLDRKIREIVDDLRRALQELVAVSHEIRAYRDALARIGGQAQKLVLADRHHLSDGQSRVEPWPTHDDLRKALRAERAIRERIALHRGDLRQMGMGPELFE